MSYVTQVQVQAMGMDMDDHIIVHSPVVFILVEPLGPRLRATARLRLNLHTDLLD